MANVHTTHVHNPREHNFADRVNDRRAAVASKLWRKAARRVGEKRAQLWVDAAIEPSEVA